MNKLSLVSIILGISGILVYLYNILAIQPNLAEVNSDYSNIVDFEVYGMYRNQSDILGLAGTSLAGIGFILAIIAFVKTKKPMTLILGVLFLAAAVLNFLASFARVI